METFDLARRSSLSYGVMTMRKGKIKYIKPTRQGACGPHGGLLGAYSSSAYLASAIDLLNPEPLV